MVTLYELIKLKIGVYNLAYMEQQMTDYSRFSEVCNTVISLGYGRHVDVKYAHAASVLQSQVYRRLSRKQAKAICCCGVQSQVQTIGKVAEAIEKTDGSNVSIIAYLFPPV